MASVRKGGAVRKPVLLAVLTGCVACGPAAAQATAGQAAADRAAMERALQQADGPRRRILEAARLKGEAPPPAPAPAAGTRPAAPPAAAQTTAQTASAAAPGGTPTRARADADPESSTATLVPGIAPLVMSAGPVGSVATVAPVETIAAPTAVPAPLGEAPPRVMDEVPPPKLLQMVEPDLPSRLFRRSERRVEIVVDLVINRDGSVRSAAVRGDLGSDVADAVSDAMRRWRYEPQPGARLHIVRLVASPG